MRPSRILIIILFAILVASLISLGPMTGRIGKETFLKIGILQGVESAPNNTINALPTSNFTLSGYVYTQSNLAVSNGTVRIIAFNNDFYTDTDQSGSFHATIGVPPNAPDGLYLVSVEFQSAGKYAPSSNSVWVKVFREPISFTIKGPTIIVSGSQASFSGTVESNGTTLANCVVSVSLPWNSYYAKTDLAGNYQIPVSVPLAQFSPSIDAVVSANPAEPYVESASTAVSVGLFNPLVLLIPGIIVGVVLYEMRNLDLLSKKEAIKSIDILREKLESVRKPTRMDNETKRALMATTGSRILGIYNTAVELASKRFNVELSDALTFRETSNEISKLDKQGRGSGIFSQIAQTMQDFVYAKKFDESRIAKIEELAQELKTIWGPQE